MFLKESNKKKMENGHILVTRAGDRCHPGTSWGGVRAKTESLARLGGQELMEYVLTGHSTQ